MEIKRGTRIPSPEEAPAEGGIAQAIRFFRRKRGFNQPQLAAMIGVTKNAVTNWESGHSHPSPANVTRLCRALDVSADALFGIPPREKGLSAGEWEHLRTYRALDAYQRGTVDALMASLLENERLSFLDRVREKFVPIRFVELQASAGTGNPLADRCEGETIYLEGTDAVRRADAVMTVSGDSMMPTFQNGDEILVERTERLRFGEIGVFELAGEAYVKEYRPEGLYSHNPHYGLIVPGEDDDIHVFGRVLGVVTENMHPDRREMEALSEMEAPRGRRGRR